DALNSFTFVTPDELAGLNKQVGLNGQKISLLRFPSGEVIDEFQVEIHGGSYSAAQKGNYRMVHPANGLAVGVIDLAAKKANMGYKTPGFAVYDPVFAGEEIGGEVSLYTLSARKQIAKVQLPDSPLSAARVTAFSDNGKWLAVSGRSRSAVWKLETGDRALYMRDLSGAFFDQDQFIARFPKREKDPVTV